VKSFCQSFEIKYSFVLCSEKRSSQLQRWRCGAVVNYKVVGLAKGLGSAPLKVTNEKENVINFAKNLFMCCPLLRVVHRVAR
jgi:hypothetical protein